MEELALSLDTSHFKQVWDKILLSDDAFKNVFVAY
jgi:hypothetical protein